MSRLRLPISSKPACLDKRNAYGYPRLTVTGKHTTTPSEAEAEAERLFHDEPEPSPKGDRPLVIYHANCMDGFGAAWVCWRQFGDHADYFAARYPSNGTDPFTMTELPDVTGREVYMVDFCVSRFQLNKLKHDAKSIQVIDHHKTHREACDGLDYCLFDMDQSGAGLTWLYFRGAGPSVPWLVKYVEDRDLWRFALPDSEAVNAYIGALEKDFRIWNDVQRAGREAAVRAGQTILLYMESYKRSVGKHHRRQEFAGYPDIPVVNTPHMISELVGELSKTAEFAVGWFQDERGQYIYSLRSRNGFDVSKVAATFGGGGHAAAAGFTVSKLVHEL